MSILINMEMPNKKNGAVLIIYPDGKCAFEDGKTYQAVSVPPHGDLIDRDAYEYPGDLMYEPVIIPASEEGEA